MLVTFVQHLMLTLTVLCLFYGFGTVVVRFCGDFRQNRDDPFVTVSQRILLGMAVAQILSTVLLTYLPFLYARRLAGLLTLSGAVILLVLVGRNLLRSGRAGLVPYGRLFGIAALSFFLHYVPFLPCEKPFLSSEGSGDHTIYLGTAKFSASVQPGHPAAQPCLGALLTNIRNRETVQGNSFLRWLAGWADRDLHPRLTKASRWDLESAERVILSGWNPGWWSMPWWLICSFPGFSPEMLYMSLIFALYASIGLGTVAVLRALGCPLILVSVAFLLLHGASVFCSVGLNHHFPQLLLIASLNGLLLSLLLSLRASKSRIGQDLAVSVLFAGSSMAHYFVSVPWMLTVMAAYLGVRTLMWLAHRRLDCEWPSLSQGVLVLVPLLLLSPHFFLNFVGVLAFSAEYSQANSLRDHFLGPPVASLSNGFASALGVLPHTLLPPFTQLRFEELFAAKLSVAAGVGVCLMGVTALLTAIFSKRDVLGSLPGLGFGPIFVVLTWLLIEFLVIKSHKHTYTFDKAASTSFPFLAAGVTVAADILSRHIRRRLVRNVAVGLMVGLAAVWAVPLAEVKAYQVASLWQSKLRSATLYSIGGRRDTGEQPGNRLFYYPGKNAELSLLETLLTGHRAIPIGQLFLDTYRELVTDIDFKRATFLVPSSDPRSYRAVSSDAFALSTKRDVWVWALSPYLDMKRSRLPRLIYLDRPKNYLELLLQANGARTIRILCLADPSQFSASVLKLRGQEHESVIRERAPVSQSLQMFERFPLPWPFAMRVFEIRTGSDPSHRVLVRMENCFLALVEGSAGVASAASSELSVDLPQDLSQNAGRAIGVLTRAEAKDRAYANW